MRISVPLAHVLQSSRGVSDIFKHQKTQIPLLAALEDGASPLDSHPIVVIGDALNWCHTARIAIGSPPQHFNAVVDVSTSDLTIPSLLSRRRSSPPLHFYNSSTSKSYTANGTEVSSNPLGIKTSGFLSQDKLHLSDLIVHDILFEEVTEYDFDDCVYCNWNYDTVLPLGLFNQSASRNFMSPIAKLTLGQLLDENVFSLRLSRNTHDGIGQLILGGPVDKRFSDGPEYTIPVTDQTNEWVEKANWKVAADSISFGDESTEQYIHHTFQGPTVAVFHTVFSWVVFPHKLAKQLNKVLGAKHWGPYAFFDCAKRPELPDLTIVLAGQKFLMTSYDYAIEQNESGRVSCMSAFLQGVEQDGIIYLGSAFLKTWVTTWDWEHRTMGFTRAIHTV
ncbi:aspartic peptidase domain-containing protein [Leptodontidium sp. MPI-SDFR-AT-0119]|nr:aspartic peptidase domain-containing protein [Leptodontidium sp. MPI-SDFR-AT-0119]